MVEIKKPIMLWNSERIDIAAKLLFIKYVEEKIMSSYGEDVYLNHLKVWNNLIEKEPIKIGVKDYLESFMQIISDVKNDRFDFRKSPIFVNTKNEVINGSHRLAAAIYFNKPVYIKQADNLSGQAHCNYEIFQAHNNLYGKFKTQYLDSMVMEYIERKENIFVITIFASAEGFDTEIVKKIKKFGDIVYRKDFFMNKENAIRFIDILYQGEEWLKNGGRQNKTNFAFPNSGYVRTFFIEVNNPEDLIELKQDLRDFFDLGKHSLHINDTREETIRISKHLLNENTIEFINNVLPEEPFENSKKLFDKFYKEIEKKEIDKDAILLDGSFVLSLFLVRDIRDLDYICRGKITINKNYGNHNKYIEKFGFNADEWLFNPEKYFYYKGIKVLWIEEAKLFKKKRNELKDKEDLLVLHSKYAPLPCSNEFEYLVGAVESIKQDIMTNNSEILKLNDNQLQINDQILLLKEVVDKLLLKRSPSQLIKRLLKYKK